MKWIKSLRLRTKVLLSSIGMTVILVTSILWMVTRGYNDERLAYVFELHSARTSVAGAAVREAVFKALQNNPRRVVNSIPTDLAREPIDAETFLSIENSQIVEQKGLLYRTPLSLYWREASGTLAATELLPAGAFQALRQVSDTRIYIVTQSGQLLFSQGRSGEKLKGDAELFEAVFRTNLTDGNTVIRRDGLPYAVGFREVEATNLIVVTETPLAQILAPLRRAIIIWVLSALPLLIIGLLIQGWFIGSMSKPLTAMVQFFESISKGNLRWRIVVPEGELRPVFEGALTMQNVIANREARLKLFAEGLRSILQLAQNPELARKLDELAEGVYGFVVHFSANHSLYLPIAIDLSGKNVFKRTQSGEWECGPIDLDFNAFSEGIELGVIGPETAQIEMLYGAGSCAALVLPLHASGVLWAIIMVPLAATQDFPELGDLSAVLNSTLDSMATFCKATDLATNEAILGRELAIARRVQEKSMVLGQQNIPGVKVATHFQPANIVGGDWVGVYHHVGKNILNFYLGDVTGHGIDAAFHTSLVAGAIQMAESQLDEEQSAAFDAGAYLTTLWHRVNKVLTGMGEGKSMTMFMASLEIDSGKMQFINAGHPFPFIVRQDRTSKQRTLVGSPAPALGSPVPGKIPVRTLALLRGDTLVPYTDGLFENIGMDKYNAFSKPAFDGILQYIIGWNTDQQNPAHDIWEWSKAVGNNYTEADDVAILALRYLGMAHLK